MIKLKVDLIYLDTSNNKEDYFETISYCISDDEAATAKSKINLTKQKNLSKIQKTKILKNFTKK